jgi:hypothetical protein
VIAADGTAFNNNLLVKFDFSNVSGTTVTDVAEKHLTGTLMNNATVKTIGTTTKINVLNLGDSINGKGYFDMGLEVGKIVANQTDYTMSCYFRVNEAYTELTKAGNFIWNFSNSNIALSEQKGYIIAALNNQSVSTTPGNYTAASGNQAVSFGTAALAGGFHNLTYTQSGSIGTLYVDGMPAATGAITNLPKTALLKSTNLL